MKFNTRTSNETKMNDSVGPNSKASIRRPSFMVRVLDKSVTIFFLQNCWSARRVSSFIFSPSSAGRGGSRYASHDAYVTYNCLGAIPANRRPTNYVAEIASRHNLALRRSLKRDTFRSAPPTCAVNSIIDRHTSRSLPRRPRD